MTPALDLLKKLRAEHRIHSYEHDPKAASYGLEAAEKLGLEPARVFRTLLASTEKGELLVAVVPVVGTLDLKALAQAAGAKKPKWLTPRRRSAQRATCWVASAHWARRSACVRSLTTQRRVLRVFTSAPGGGGWRLSFRQPCWPSIRRLGSHRLAGNKLRLSDLPYAPRRCLALQTAPDGQLPPEYRLPRPGCDRHDWGKWLQVGCR